MNEQEYLIHYGVLGMKWGRRKSKPSKSSGKKSSRKSKNKVKKKINKLLTDSRKQKLKQVGKSAAMVAGTVAAAATLGSLGAIGMNAVYREMHRNEYQGLSYSGDMRNARISKYDAFNKAKENTLGPINPSILIKEDLPFRKDRINITYPLGKTDKQVRKEIDDQITKYIDEEILKRK